jgi:hypothetical protein
MVVHDERGALVGYDERPGAVQKRTLVDELAPAPADEAESAAGVRRKTSQDLDEHVCWESPAGATVVRIHCCNTARACGV